MLKDFRRRRRLARVRPGDGRPRPDYRFWQLFTRSLFLLRAPRPDGGHQLFEVDIRHGRDSSSAKRPAALYRDGVQVAEADLPVAFPVPGGVIEVATTVYGLKRIHYVTDDGAETLLSPHPRSLEGRRARFAQRAPLASAAVAAMSIVVLLAGLSLTLLTVAAALSRTPPIASALGVFTSPVQLSGWLAIAVPLITTLAAVERGTALRSNWLLRGGA